MEGPLVHYLLAALALGAACIVWYGVQRASGRAPGPSCAECEAPECEAQCEKPAKTR